MNRQTAALQGPLPYDKCQISTCLKQLFQSAHRAKAAEPEYVITSELSTIKTDVEQLNDKGHIELSYAYLSVMEASLPQASYRYAIVYRQNTPVLFCYFQLYTLTSRNFNLKDDKTFVKGILGYFLDLKKARVLVAGNALRNETPCCSYADSVSKDEAAELVASIAEEIAATESATVVMLKDVPMSAHTRKFFSRLGYHSPMADQVMNMPIDSSWESLADYTAALSRKYKTRANKILKAGSSLTVRQLEEDELEHYQTTIHRLFKNVTDNQSFALTLPGNDHFLRLKEVYKDDFEVHGFFHGGKLVAFYSAFVTEPAYEVYYVGFDYKVNEEYNLYFNILFAGLERAIRQGKKELKLGRTSFDAKASLGATPAENSYYVKTACLPTIVSKWFVNYFSAIESSKWKLRNPLKVTQLQ